MRYGIRIRKTYADREVFQQVFVRRFYDHPCIANLSPSLIVDAGAHIGLSAIFFASKFPDAQIIAIEAEKGNFDLLKLNCQPYSNIICFHAALWYEHTRVSLSSEADSWAFRCCPDECGSVEAFPIDHFIGHAIPDILKLDIEGAERELFSFGEVPVPKVLFLETHDRFVPGSSLAAFAYLSGRSFNRYISGDMDVVEFICQRC